MSFLECGKCGGIPGVTACCSDNPKAAPSTEGLKPIYVRFSFGGFSAVSAHPDGSNDMALAEGFVKYIPATAQASEAAIRNVALEKAAADVLAMHDADISACGQHYAKGSVKDKAWKNLRSALQSTTPAEPVADNWLPIESVPVETEVLLIATLHSMLMPDPQRVVGRKDSRGGWWSTCGATLSHVQCWQPLPPPPAAKEPT